MNRKFFLLLNSLLVCAISLSQTNVFKLRIEPHNSAGELGVLATLTNLSDHVYTIPSFSNTTSLMLPKACILIPEIEMDNANITDGIQQGFFYSELSKKANIQFKPGESYQIWVPLNERISDLTGIASPSKVDKVKKVRFKLTEFKAFTIVDKKIHLVDTTLYSNWLNINL